MDENTAIQPLAKETNFLVWSAARRIGVAHKSTDGGIVVKLDPGEVVKSANIFILHPAVPADCGRFDHQAVAEFDDERDDSRVRKVNATDWTAGFRQHIAMTKFNEL
jgi:hypothetical protein